MEWSTLAFDWNRARAFLVAAEEGSYSAAARALGVSQPTIGRQIAGLEEELGVTVFARVGRGLALTDAGLDLVQHVRMMGDGAMALSRSASGRSASLEGIVRITASEVISAYLMPPVVARLRREHPGIEIELVVSNELRDLRRREADLAIRNMRPEDPDLIARSMGDRDARLYGTPDYLRRVGPIETPADLVRAEIFGFDRGEQMISFLQAIGAPVTAANFPVVTGAHLVQWSLCREGLGLCFMMTDVGERCAEVVAVGEHVPPVPVAMWLVAHREVRTSRRLRVVADAIVDALEQPGVPTSARSGEI